MVEEQKIMLTEMVDQVMAKPSLLSAAVLAPIRHLVTDVISRPNEYGLSAPSDYSAFAGISQGPEEPELTSDLANRLLHRQPVGGEKLQLSEQPVIQVTCLSLKMEKHGDHKYKKYTLHVIDGDSSHITAKINTSLNSSMAAVKVGSILRLLNSFPVYYDFDNSADHRVFLIIHNFINCGISFAPF